MTDEQYLSICTATIKKAVWDYKKAVKQDKPKKQKKIERFFLSEWGQTLSLGNGEKIIARLKTDKQRKENEKNERM